MYVFFRLRAGLVLPFVLLSCGGESPNAAAAAAGDAAAEPVRWTVAQTPSLEIGVLSGEEAYQLHRASSSVRLPDGRIVVANAGSAELRFFDPEGKYLTAQGARGDGPGEWRYLARVRLHGPDTLLVVDPSLRRNGLVSTAGEFIGTLPWREDQLFPSDEFLHGRFVVDAPLAPADRGVVTRALTRSAEADSGRVARVLATPTGHIWVTDGVRAAPDGTTWRVYDLEGRRVATVATPPGFTVHDVGPDWVLGVVRGEMDVQYLRLYPLEGAPDGSREVLERAARASDAPAPRFARWPTDSVPHLSALMKMMASAQEIHYSEHSRYTTSRDTLLSRVRGGVPEDVRFEPIVGDDQGWMWRVVDEATGAGCMLTYGSGGILGLAPGAVVCFAPGTGTAGG